MTMKPPHARGGSAQGVLGHVAGNVKEEGMRAIEKNGPFVIDGDRDIMQALDALLASFVEQQRTKPLAHATYPAIASTTLQILRPAHGASSPCAAANSGETGDGRSCRGRTGFMPGELAILGDLCRPALFRQHFSRRTTAAGVNGEGDRLPRPLRILGGRLRFNGRRRKI